MAAPRVDPRRRLLKRHPDNPILTAFDWPYFVNTVFNAGAVRLPSGETLLLCRVEDCSGHSHLCVARSQDGVTDWKIDPEPTFQADPEKYPQTTAQAVSAHLAFAPIQGGRRVTGPPKPTSVASP